MKKILWTIFIVITVLTMVITPITIHVFSPSMTSELSADGILDYMGNGIAAIPTIIIALVAIWQTNKANYIAEDANKMSVDASNIAKKANEISEQLLQLEITRQRLDLRPAFVISEWSAPIKSFERTSLRPDDFSIQIGEYSEKEAWGLKLTFFNISSGYETIGFNSAIAKDGSFEWTNSMTSATSRKIGLAPSEKKCIYFYADKEVFESQLGKAIEVEFYVNNRLDEPYREKMELFIMSMSDTVVHKEGEAYVHLEIQNYKVGRCVEKSPEFPDGVIWEVQV